MTLRGTISWPGFGRSGEDWFGFLFVVTHFSGAPLKRNPEGELLWIEIEEVEKLSLWDGYRHFLPLVFDAVSRRAHAELELQPDLSPHPAACPMGCMCAPPRGRHFGRSRRPHRHQGDVAVPQKSCPTSFGAVGVDSKRRRLTCSGDLADHNAPAGGVSLPQ